MLTGIGYQPFDSSAVTILNVSDQAIRNIRVHFRGCEGYETYATYPDSYSSAKNPNPNDPKKPFGQITLRYENLPPSYNKNYIPATIIFYGESTSNCSPTVEAELADGKNAIGKELLLQSYWNESYQENNEKAQLTDFLFRLLVLFAALYFLFQIHSLKKRINAQETNQIDNHASK